MKKRNHTQLLSLRISLMAAAASTSALMAAPAGPAPQVPDGGKAPGAFPNTSVTAVTVTAKGSTTFNSSVDVPGVIGQGPIPWTINRYNRGDFALRLSPNDAAAALGNLGKGFSEFADNTPGLAANQAWRPTPVMGVVIPTSTQNGPIDWNDGEGPFFPTIALSESSSGPGYDMVTGVFASGNMDINTGRAGTHASSPEANFSFSATWFPYDQGWIGGEAAGPDIDGTPRWTQPAAHTAGISAGVVKWPEYPEGFGLYGGLAELRLPGVNSLTNGMLFATSSDGSSDVNVVGVAPKDDGAGWSIAIREDSATDAETLVDSSQSEFQFVYIPYTAANLVGGYINGTTGAKITSKGDFTVARTGAGVYELTVPGKTGADGTVLLQVADWQAGTSSPLPTRAFLSYSFNATSGKFVIQSRFTATDTTADLIDANFYVAWVDFKTPLSPPPGPRLRTLGRTTVTPVDFIAREAGVAVNTDEPEVLVTTIDSANFLGYVDPDTGAPAVQALVGYFYNPVTLQPTRDPFVIFSNPSGNITRHDVKYNPVSKQYAVVCNARSFGTNARNVPVVTLVNPNSVAGDNSPVVKSVTYNVDTENNYDDVALAVSSKNGNILVAAEYSFPGEGEGVVAVLFDKAGTLLTPEFKRLDQLQPAGDEDDPDVVYLPKRDVFFFVTNIDRAQPTDPLGNRITGSVVLTTPDGSGNLQIGPQQVLTSDRLGGVTEGHPSSIENPFNGELITAFDLGGNNVSKGDISYYNIGAAPGYAFTSARAEIPYLDGPVAGDPYKHNHPQMAVDPAHGVFVVGMNAADSTVGFPAAYAFLLLGPDGEILPSQLGAPYALADGPGNISGSANFQNIKYSPASGSFVVAFNTNPGVTYLATLEVTSDHLAPAAPPVLSIAASGNNVVITWPASATGFGLESAASFTTPWAAINAAVTEEGGLKKVTVPATDAVRFFRLRK